MKSIQVLLFILCSALARADYPPTTAKDSTDSGNVTTFFYQFPNFTGTHTGPTFSLGVNSVSGGGTGSTSFTAGSLLFSNGTVVTQNNAKLFWDNTNYRLGIGTLTGVASIDSALTISENVSTLPAPVAGTYNLVHVGSLDGVSNTVLYDAFGGVNQYLARRADGTAASPTAVQSGDIIGQFGWLGYGATSYQTTYAAKFMSSAAENWSDTTGAAILQFFTRPSGTVGTSSERMRIDQNGNVGIGTTTPLQALDLGATGAARVGTVVGASSIPTVAYGTGAGTGPSTVALIGSEIAGYIQFTTGTTPAVGTVFTMTIPIACPNYIFAVFQAANANAAGVMGRITSASTASTFTLVSNTVGVAGALAASTTYAFNWVANCY